MTTTKTITIKLSDAAPVKLDPASGGVMKMNTGPALHDRIARLNELTVHHGKHDNFTEGHCALEVVAWLAGEEHSDYPVCACPTISSFIRTWNDGIKNDDVRTRVLRPLLPLLLNTRAPKSSDGDKVLVRRSYMAIDWDLRVRTPAFLRVIGLEEEAKALESLPEIASAQALSAAKAASGGASEKASAARNAASSVASSAARNAAESAAWSAALSAASSVALSAARNAALSAARNAASSVASSAASSAAWDAAWDAASSAAWNAAESAASSAAWDAASSAASSAAWDAAGSAATAKLQPTVEALQASAADLVRCMCALTVDDVNDWSWE